MRRQQKIYITKYAKIQNILSKYPYLKYLPRTYSSDQESKETAQPWKIWGYKTLQWAMLLFKQMMYQKITKIIVNSTENSEIILKWEDKQCKNNSSKIKLLKV